MADRKQTLRSGLPVLWTKRGDGTFSPTVSDRELIAELREEHILRESVPNPNVEEGTDAPSGWNAGANTEWADVGYESNKSLRLHPTDGQGDWRSDVFHAKADSWYRVRARVQGEGNANTHLTIRFFEANDDFISEVNIPLNGTFENWQEVRSDVQAPANTAKADLMLRQTDNGTIDIYADRFSVREV